MKKQLAIMGHQTRGKEVIDILQMLGGEKTPYGGESVYNIYYLDDSKNIITEYYLKTYVTDLAFEVFTLEEFLEKYPYKVGNKVTSTDYSGYGNIVKMHWDSNNCCMKYQVNLEDSGFIARFKWFNHNEIMMCEDVPNKICRIFISDKDYQDKVELCLGDEYEMVVENGKTFLQKKESKYPTTYEECCDVLKIPKEERYIDIDVPLSYNNLLYKFTELLICRDAYWKIAGEQMWLYDSWEPNWTDNYETKHIINFYQNEINFTNGTNAQYILSFPTEEMRDAFYKNFEELINECKQLL